MPFNRTSASFDREKFPHCCCVFAHDCNDASNNPLLPTEGLVPIDIPSASLVRNNAAFFHRDLHVWQQKTFRPDNEKSCSINSHHVKA